MSELQTFRHYTICQDQHGATVEVWRSADEVACLAFDNRQLVFVELRVAIGPAERQRDAASFQHLVQLAAPLRHRHLLGILEGGEDEGTNYHISEFLDGERLDSWLARCAPLPPWLALHVFRQLVEGLAALASHPRLLAGVAVFHAGLTLGGPHPENLTVKLCDLGLSGSLPVSTDPRFVEARAIHETGRLLLYMLTGALADEPVHAAALTALGLPPELAFLLETIFTAGKPHHPRTLEQLRILTGRCARDLSPELTALPETLPAAFQPRLPLADHLPSAHATADALGGDFTLDTRPPEAADPYRHFATERANRRPVNIRVFPPARILPPESLNPALEKAWAALAPLSSASPPALPSRLLHPLALHAGPPFPAAAEEFPGKLTLETLRRLRGPLLPEETLLILAQLDEAAAAAEALGLPLHWRSPGQIPVVFLAPDSTGATGPRPRPASSPASPPPPATLASLPLEQWPAFTLKVRTWPLTTDFTQPDKFLLEYLLPRDPAVTADPAGRQAAASIAPPPPSSRDFALLGLWLLGGSAHLPEALKPVFHAALSTRGPASAGHREFLAKCRRALSPVLAGSAPFPAATPQSLPARFSPEAAPAGPVPVAALASASPPAAKLSRKDKKRAGPSASPDSVPALDAPAAPSPPPAPPAVPEAGPFVSPFAPPPDESWLSAGPPAAWSGAGHPLPEPDPAVPALSFAEALFGSSPGSGNAAEKTSSRRRSKKSRVPVPEEPPTTALSPGLPVWPQPVFPGPSPLSPLSETHPWSSSLGGSSPPAGRQDTFPPPAGPPGFMEAAGQSIPDRQNWEAAAEAWEQEASRKTASRWMLLLIVILISAAIAALMAQLSGQAVWLE